MRAELKQHGRLVCVGVGMTMGAHISERTRDAIEKADVVFVLVSDGIVEQWVEAMNDDVRSLQPYYQLNKSRRNTYREMIAAMVDEVAKGHSVCGVFYGHPGVFAYVPHEAIRQAKAAGYPAKMEAGVSAEDCLYADLGIDPGRFGCQHYEASQFMFYKRQIDPSAYLILWQIGIAGDRSLALRSTSQAYRQILLDLLSEHYPMDHEVIVYETNTLPITQPRMDAMSLQALLKAELTLESTLVIPPSQKMTTNEAVMTQIHRLQKQSDSDGINSTEEAT